MRCGFSGRSPAIAALLALGACQTPSATMRQADIPAGRSLVSAGVATGGNSLVTVGATSASCGAPEVWGRTGQGWTKHAEGTPLAASSCPALGSRLSADGGTVAVYDFNEARAMVYDLAASGVTPAGSA
ncbi:MAG: hypothetical protein U1E17_25330, partial [Geminicoccaceae bacterium]